MTASHDGQGRTVDFATPSHHDFEPGSHVSRSCGRANYAKMNSGADTYNSISAEFINRVADIVCSTRSAAELRSIGDISFPTCAAAGGARMELVLNKRR